MADVWSAAKGAVRRVADDARLRRLVTSRGAHHDVVRRFIAGESAGDALEATGELLVRGRLVSLTHLSSDPLDAQEARARRKRVRKLVRRLSEHGLSAGGRVEVSVRFSSFGAALGPAGPQTALEHARVLAQAASNAGTHLVVETEPGLPVDLTLRLLHRLRMDHPDVGVAVQASNPRTEEDCVALAREGVRVRLGRGYGGPGALGGHEGDLAFLRCLRILLDGGGPLVVAPRDPRLFAVAEALVERSGTRAVEYSLRYGVHPELQAVVADRGEPMRVYVPFGDDWGGYVAARVVEQPSLAAALLLPSATG